MELKPRNPNVKAKAKAKEENALKKEIQSTWSTQSYNCTDVALIKLSVYPRKGRIFNFKNEFIM